MTTVAPRTDDLIPAALIHTVRELEADLLTGVIGLDLYARHGLPAVLADVGDPAEELRDVIRNTDPSDLCSPGVRSLWCAVRRLYARAEPLTWEALINTASKWWPEVGLRRLSAEMESIGLSVPYAARPAARQLLRLAAARERFSEARDAAASASEEVRAALVGVAA